MNLLFTHGESDYNLLTVEFGDWSVMSVLELGTVLDVSLLRCAIIHSWADDEDTYLLRLISWCDAAMSRQRRKRKIRKVEREQKI